MKKILLLLLLLPFGKIVAQKSYVQQADERFASLDKSKITTNILYDRVVGEANLAAFGKEENEKTTPDRFLQGFYEMKLANYKTETSLSSDNVLDIIKNYNANKKVPLGVLDYAFNSIDAVTKDKYLTHQLQMVVALQMTRLEVGKHTFSLPNSLHFGNQENAIASVSVDFGENNQKVTFNASYNNNQAVEIRYSVGQKTLRYTLTLKTGKVISYTSTLNISETARVVAPCYKDAALTPSLGKANLQADIPFTSYNNDKPLDSPYGRGEVEYFLRLKNTDGSISNLCPATNLDGLKKPIIMLDGFDPLDDRTISKLYLTNLTYDTLSTPRKNLADDLRNQGYDVVILNFPKHEIFRQILSRINPRFSDTLIVYQDHGTDYVERNAMVLVKLIQQINAKLATNGSAEQLTIVGPSMGGLISQYALAYMEKNGMNHNTRLWISHDSPHNGANIPIGAQEFLRWSGEDQSTAAALRNLNVKIRSVAAKQMLLHHISTNIANPNTQVAAPDPFRAIFLANVASNGLAGSGGFPQNLRRVAVANGSDNGQLYGLAGDEAVRLEYVKLGQVRARAMAYFSGGYGQLRRSMYYEKNMTQTCWAGIIPYPCVVMNGVSERSFASPSYTVSYDAAPGGAFNTFEIIKNE